MSIKTKRPPERLRRVKGVGDAVICELKVVEAAAHRLSQARIRHRQVLSSWDALLDYCRTAMAHRATEQFRKRHVFRDWALRARMPESELPALASLLLDGGPEMEAVVNIERDGGELIAFSDEKSLFLAVKP